MMLAVSCEKTDDTPTLEVSPTTVEFTATEASPQTVTVKAQNVAWDYSVSADAKSWLTVTQDGNTLTLTAADNNKAEKRNGQIRIEVTDGSKLPARSVTVTQQANANPPEMTLTLNPASLTFDGEGAAPQTVTVTASAETLSWTAAPDEASAAWITVTSDTDTFTVSVANNPDTERRAGTVVVTPSDDAATAKAVRVIQEGKVIPPSLSVSPSTPIEIAYNEDTNIILNVEAVNTEWSARAENADGNALSWVSVVTSTGEGYVNVMPERNTLKEPRSGFIVVTAEAEGIEEVRIPISQTAAPDYLSTLDGDLELNTLGLSHGHSTLSPYSPDDTIIVPTSEWDINLMSEGVAFNTSTGQMTGTGYRLHFIIVTDRMVINDDDLYTIPDGAYEVVTSKPMDDNPDEIYYKDAWTIDKGTEGTSSWTKYTGFWYTELQEGEIVGSAPVVSGTVTVTKLSGYENSYTFVFDTKDDFGNAITGTYSGSIGLTANGKTLPD